MTSILPEKTHIGRDETHTIAPMTGWMDRAPIAWRRRVVASVRDLFASPREAVDSKTFPTPRNVDGLGLNPGDTVTYGVSIKPGSTRDIKPDTDAPGWEATAACPDWCEADHALDDEQGKRSHFSDFVEIPLCHDDGNSINGFNVPTLVLDVSHSPETVEPRIQLDCDSDRHWVDMTPDDAESLAHHLLDMVEQIKTATYAKCEHDFPLVLTASAAKAGACTKCGAPHRVKSGRDMFDGEN